ncbi:hypothetical protein [Pedobacter sp. B4-66]|uniref:hypothetical protein n=1 Tax=Pedobacter sp. B4-66 TaxID=2817280 RepID=UPI001BDB37EF|nr:hypothetical protein [Pedobacter sp. B4-66]
MVYKILFEVKLLHEFYLTDKAGKNIFEFGTQGSRLSFLKERFENNDENIDAVITFEIPRHAKVLFNNYHLKLLPSYAGFKVAVKVIPKKLPGGITAYEPVNTLPDDLCIPVLAVKKSNHLDNFTNSKMERALPATYYFSNDNVISGNRFFPFLSADIPAFDATASYEQGELLKFGANDYRGFYKDEADTVQWISLSGKAFANENDRILLPLNFYYAFPKSSSITSAVFTIKDNDGNVADKFQFKNNQAYRKILLAIDEKKVFHLPVATANDKLIYTLQVTGNGGYNRTHKIIFYQDEKEIRDSLGLIVMKVKTPVAAYNLLDNGGRLITRKQIDGTISPAPPVFELNFKSKLSFWRYINNRRKDLKTGMHPDFLLSKNGSLISKMPRALTHAATLFRRPDNTLYYLPNPDPYQTVVLENNKMYTDIMVQESALFPLAP